VAWSRGCGEGGGGGGIVCRGGAGGVVVGGGHAGIGRVVVERWFSFWPWWRCWFLVGGRL